MPTPFVYKPLAIAIAAVCFSSSISLAAQAESNQSSDQNEHALAKKLINFDIPAGQLTPALNQLAHLAGEALAYSPALVKEKTTQGIKGRYSIAQALKTLLVNTNLVAVKHGSAGGYIIKKMNGASSNIAGTLALTTVGNEGSFGDAPAEEGGFKAQYHTTATKMAMPLKETPQAISVVTRDSLDARQVKDLSTAVELIAGVSNSADSMGLQTGPGMFGGLGQYDQKFVMRGQPTSVRSDGFKVGNNNVDLAAYERVEVLKGPAGFYGQGSLGGFINLVRKKPQAEFSANVSAQVGSFDTKRTDIDVTGALNNDASLNGHVSMVYEDSGSFVDELDNNKFMLAPSIEVIINDNTRILTQLLYQKDEFDNNGGIPLQLVGDQIKRYDNFSSPTELYGSTGDKSETEITELIVRVDHQVSDRWLASVLLQANKSTRDIIKGNAGYVFDDYLYTGAEKDIWERDVWAVDLRLEGAFDAFGQTHQVLIGAEHNDQHRTRDWGYSYMTVGEPESFSGDFSNYPFVPVEDVPTSITRDNNTDNSAIYAQVVLSLQEKTKLLISGRYDKTYSKLIFTSWGDLNEPAAVKQDAFTTRLGLTHGFNDNFSAYAVYAESFEPTGEIASPANGGGILDPITGEGYELGLKTDWLDNKLGATLAIYQQDLTNRPMIDPDDTSGQYSISSGLHRTEGIELEITSSPYQGLTVTAAASWQENEFLEDDNNKGLSIDGSVDEQFSLYASYEWQTGALQGLAAGATFVNVGERKFIEGGKQIYLEGYHRADMHLSYNALPNWDISLLVRNITDENYIESATPKYAFGSFRGSPRAVLLTVSYDFN